MVLLPLSLVPESHRPVWKNDAACGNTHSAGAGHEQFYRNVFSQTLAAGLVLASASFCMCFVGL